MTTAAYADLAQSGPDWQVHRAWAGGAPLCTLWTHAYRWRCSDAELQLRVIALAEQPILAAEPTEPLAGAIARLCAHHALPEALCCLHDPARTLAEERLRWAWGLRAFALASEADEACWDRAWLAGIAAYGLRDRLRLTLHGRADAQGVLLALAYGHAVSCQADLLAAWEETPQGMSWRLRGDGEVAVLGAGGFELARIAGREGSWRDRGDEGLVRAVISADGRSCWSQPRLVRAQPAGASMQ